MAEDDFADALDSLIAHSTEDPADGLRALVRRFGREQTEREARIVFGSWRSTIDHVERVLNEVLTEEG